MLTIPLDSAKKEALYEQIYAYIKTEIKDGRLSCQTKLPSTRSLAAHLAVSRNTVDLAYSQLVSEGYVQAIPKSGYYVCELAPIHDFPGITVNNRIREETAEEISYRYDFSPSSVDLSHFPYAVWRQLSKSCLKENRDVFLLGDRQGDLAFRQAIAAYLHQSRAVHCQEDQIIVGAGVDYLLQLLSQIFGTSNKIAVEDPVYQQANYIFRGYGITTVPIPLDQSGMDISALEKSGCNIAFVTPSHQYPLGIIMPIKRRIALLNWASGEDGRYIIEDDHDSEFRYIGKPVPSLQGTAWEDNVIYIGTFSKAIAPSIRAGYMVLPRKLLSIYQEKFHFYTSTVSRIDQAILTGFLEKGYFERHLNRMRKVYKARHDWMLKELKKWSPYLEVSGENAGMYLVIKIKTGETEESFIKRAACAGIKLYGLKEHYINLPFNYIPAVMLGYAALPEEEITEGIDLLGKVLLSQ